MDENVLKSNHSLNDHMKKEGSCVLVSLDKLELPEKELRYIIHQEKLEKLAETIKSIGLIEPLIVRPKEAEEQRFEIIAGCRRFRAAKEAGLCEVPVIIRQLSQEETLEAAIVENLQRENLNTFEETEAILRLLSLKLGKPIDDIPTFLYRMQRQMRERNSTNNVIGKDEVARVQGFFYELGLMSMDSFINNRLPILNLPHEILAVLRQGKLAYTKALAVARLSDDNSRKQLLKEAVDENMSLSNIRQKIRDLTAEKDVKNNLGLETLNRRVGAIYRRIKKNESLASSPKRQKLEELITALEELLIDAP